jgi:hypothetical protein
MRRSRSSLRARPSLDFGLKLAALGFAVVVCMVLNHALAAGGLAAAAPF